MIDLETKFSESYDSIIGCDEVGRGPIAGPVVACSVHAKTLKSCEKLLTLNVTDSKKLSSKKRLAILEQLSIDVNKLVPLKSYEIKIGDESLQFSLCSLDHNVIDEVNILQASLTAMKNSSDLFSDTNDLILIDGNKAFKSVATTMPIVKGDSKSVLIGLASIIAKEFRDGKMKEYDRLYPGYNFTKHAGYPTKDHRHAVSVIGPSPIHRKSFKGVKEFL